MRLNERSIVQFGEELCHRKIIPLLTGLSVSHSSLPAKASRLPDKTGSGFLPGIEMEKGYFKIWRRIRFHPIWRDPHSLSAFLYCLNHAEWEAGRKIIFDGKEIILQPGQLECGRKQIAKEMGLSEQNVRTSFYKLRLLYKILTIKSTNKKSLISILNWESYQQVPTRPLTSNQPAANQQLTTLEAYKHTRIQKKASSFKKKVIETPTRKNSNQDPTEYTPEIRGLVLETISKIGGQSK